MHGETRLIDPMEQLRSIIDKHWGFRTLRPLQEQAMAAVVARRDSLLVLPTGGGKSLCYQAPALLRPQNVTVVVSPLISLMKDQVDSLRAAAVPARHIDSSLTDTQRIDTFRELRANWVRLLFVSPERLMMPNFQQFLQELGVDTFAIDEAHCISHWGHDFRPEYRQLRTLRQSFPTAVFHAFTATATEQVRADIVTQLALRDPEILVGNFDRANLCYRVLTRTSMLDQTVEVLNRHKGEAGIIYCLRRKDVDKLAADLRSLGFQPLAYHAGLTPHERRSAQEAFRGEKCDLIVATVAFGMGIDRSNVRFVLHAGMPKSIEHYQQEAGRAGRDGLEAECVLLATAADFMTWQRMLAQTAKENELEPDFLSSALGHLKEMHRYCQALRCRHRMLVEHFGQAFNSDNCRACDICLEEYELESQSQDIARKVLSCVARVRESFGAGYVTEILIGKKSARIQNRGHDTLSTYGLLKQYEDRQVRDWIYQLTDLGVLEQSGKQYPILTLNSQSWEVMQDRRKVALHASRRSQKGRRARPEEEAWEGVDRDLFEQLKSWRKSTAGARGWAPFAVFSDVTLRELARVRPSTLERISTIYGIGATKLQAFGDELIELIRRWCAQHDVATNRAHSRSKPAAFTRAEAYFEHFRRGATIVQVAALSRRTAGTITKYLCRYIEHERPRSIDAWVDRKIQQQVLEAASRHDGPFLKPIFDALEGKISYDSIRIVLAHKHAASSS